MPYTLTQAASAVGRTRQAIQSAIKKGTISAQKDAFGQWQIDPAELHRVYAPIKSRPANDDSNLRTVDSEKEAEIRELRARLEALEQLKREIENRNAELKQERDDWKHQADEWRMQSKALPAPEGTSTPSKKAVNPFNPFTWFGIVA